MPGEIAEMMLEGILCEGCGEYIGEGEGFPGYCSEECARGRGMPWCEPVERESPQVKAERKRARATAMEPRCCLFCGKKCSNEQGVNDHMKAVHRATVTWARLPEDQP